MRYTARAKRWERGWEIHVDGVGVTQCRLLRDAAAQAAALVETYLDIGVRPEDIEVTPELGDLGAEARRARQMTRSAAEQQREAAVESRRVARALRAQGLSVSDTADVLGVSRGRVSQLVR